MNMKGFLPGISSIGILLIVFFTVVKVSRIVLFQPIIFLLIFAGLMTYYIIQTSLSILAAKMLGLKYEEGMVLIIGATASSQVISLSIAAMMFSPLTVFALSFKPILQVAYIVF
jgi:ACR3 family arsenite transporter